MEETSLQINKKKEILEKQEKDIEEKAKMIKFFVQRTN